MAEYIFEATCVSFKDADKELIELEKIAETYVIF